MVLLTHQEQEMFKRTGYLVAKNVLCAESFQPLIDVISQVVDRRAEKLRASGEISELYRRQPFDRRWYKILAQCGRQNEVYGWHTAVFSPQLFNLIVHPAVLEVIESLIGGEIQFNGDFWVRPKLPNERLTTLPWHQDSGYMPNTEHHTHLTVWLPMVDVDMRNGPLQFIPGSHKQGLKPNQRIDGEAFKVPVEDPAAAAADIHTLEMNVGDLLVFHNLAFHRSLLNRSDMVRWSVDFRFSRIGTPLDGLWHESIAYIARSRLKPDIEASWEDWHSKWEASAHKTRFV